MSDIAQELSSQPSCWETAADLSEVFSNELPATGERVMAVGCGTSLYMAQAYASRREAAGRGETDAFPASEAPTGRDYDRVVVICRSGTTSEVIAFLDACRHPSTALVAVEDSPVAERATSVIGLAFADERSVVQTRFATSALALLRTNLGEDIGPIIADGRDALSGPLPVDPSAFDHFVFLGKGWTIGLANEAALKLREACGATSESYPAMEYRHGPISLASGRSLVWMFDPQDEELAADVGRTGATVLSTGRDPMADLVSVHRLAVALAVSKGLDPDNPVHLTRSVVLP